MVTVDFRKHFPSKDILYIVPQGCRINLHLYIPKCEMELLGQILSATAMFQVVTCLTILLSHTSTDLLTQGAIILSRRSGRQCLVTLIRERCVTFLFIRLSICFLTATFQASIHTPSGYPGKSPTNIYADGHEVCY